MSSVHDISNIVVNNNNITVEFKKQLKVRQLKKQDFIVHKNDLAVVTIQYTSLSMLCLILIFVNILFKKINDKKSEY